MGPDGVGLAWTSLDANVKSTNRRTQAALLARLGAPARRGGARAARSAFETSAGAAGAAPKGKTTAHILLATLFSRGYTFALYVGIQWR